MICVGCILPSTMLSRILLILAVLGGELAIADSLTLLQARACTPSVLTGIESDGSSGVQSATRSVTDAQITGSSQATATYCALGVQSAPSLTVLRYQAPDVPWQSDSL